MYINPVLFSPMTNRESWTQPIYVRDQVTGDLIDLTDCAIEFEVRKTGASSSGPGYSSSYLDIGYDDCGPILQASVGNGVTILDVGVFQVYFSVQSMQTLVAGTYDVGCTVSRDIDVRQLFRGRLPILSGYVRTQ